jgi:hypothetical protein
MDLFKISQNTLLYGVIDPHLPESPKVQIEVMLAKNHTQPTHVDPTTIPPPFINNSNIPTNPNDAQSQFSSNNNSTLPQPTNNFDKYYNTFRGIYQENLQSSTNSAPPPSITNNEFFTNNTTSTPINENETTSTTSQTIEQNMPQQNIPQQNIPFQNNAINSGNVSPQNIQKVQQNVSPSGYATL